MEDLSITKCFLRSDNASCYHNTELVLSLKAMGKRHRVKFKHYDFSDSQSGKDFCDRRIASIKTPHATVGKRGPWHPYCGRNNMKIALGSHEGVRGCRFAVVEIDKVTQNSQVKKIPGIIFLNNFVLWWWNSDMESISDWGRSFLSVFFPLQAMLKEVQ